MEEQSINHRQHKVMLFLLKIIPAVMAVSYFLNVFCAFMGIGLQIASHYLGMFLAPMMYLYISSYVFKFCEYHRWFIHYLVVSEFVTLTDWYFKIPVSNEIMCMIHFGITGVFIVGVIIFNIYKYRTLIKNKILTIISSIKNKLWLYSNQ